MAVAAVGATLFVTEMMHLQTRTKTKTRQATSSIQTQGVQRVQLEVSAEHSVVTLLESRIAADLGKA